MRFFSANLLGKFCELPVRGNQTPSQNKWCLYVYCRLRAVVFNPSLIVSP